MKKVLFITALLGVFGFANAQKVTDAELPAAVKAMFKSTSPTATGVKWEKEDGNYEGHYKSGGTEMTTVIDPSGKLVQTEVAISGSALPKAAINYLAKNQPGKKIVEAAKIKDASGKISYEAEVDKKDYTFDEKGNFVKTEEDND